MFSCLLLAGVAGAQQGTSEVRGRVLDGTGASLPGVTVTVKNQASGMFRETLSGDSGAFIASALVPGRYEVSATLAGFKLQLRTCSSRRPPATIDVTMEVAAWRKPYRHRGTPLVDVPEGIAAHHHRTLVLVRASTATSSASSPAARHCASIITESFGSEPSGQRPGPAHQQLHGRRRNNNDYFIGQRAGCRRGPD